MISAAQKRYEAEAEAERLGSISAKRRSRALVSELLQHSDGRLFTLSEAHAAVQHRVELSHLSKEVNG